MTSVQHRDVPLFTLDGVHDAEVTTHFITTEDMLSLSAFRFLREPSDDVVLLIHGLTTSTDMFVMPEHYNVVDYLLDHGYSEVWSLDFRMSNRHSYNMRRHSFTLDDVALYDFPAAIAKIRETIGDRRLHVICHCLGAVSFMMSLFGGAVTGITSVIANSVGLTPRVPRWSELKLASAPFMVEKVLGMSYLDPRAIEDPGYSVGRLLSAGVSKFHRECEVPACHMLSMMWGTGWPALYSHENLHDVTHRRGGDLYGPTSMNYYRHVRKMVKNNSTAVKWDPDDDRFRSLPDNYFDRAEEVRTPVLLVTGEDNKVFTDSNVECHRRLERLVPGRHQLHVFPGYGHQDPFMGIHNDRDVFPRLVEFLDEHRGGR